MANLKDSTIQNLLVNGDATVNGKLMCNDLGLEIVTVSTPRYTFQSNSWVSPFSYCSEWYDVTSLVTSVEGFIGVAGTNCIASSGVPMPSRCNLDSNGKYIIQGISGYAENWFKIDVLRIKPN